MTNIFKSFAVIVALCGAMLLTTSITSASTSVARRSDGATPVAQLYLPYMPVCNGNNSNCNGRLPFAAWAPGTGNKLTCQADQRSVYFVNVSGGVVRLMYSDRCKTNWSQFTATYQGGPWITNANITRSDGLHYDSTAYARVVVSPMVYSPIAKSKACGSTANWKGGCTPFI